MEEKMKDREGRDKRGNRKKRKMYDNGLSGVN
jgi:hypothetical protein